MGCNVMKRRNITINSNVKYKKTSTWNSINRFNIDKKFECEQNVIKINYFNTIKKDNCINIINFLSYNDLKEIGKVNRKFNFMIKTNNILVKFFRRKSSFNEKIMNRIINYRSFSELQNISTIYN